MNIEVVKNYYGKVLKSSEDLKTSACCDGGGFPLLEPLLANVHEEVRAKYYGCGIVVPAALEAARVLDLGSGSGRDVYMMAQLVGPKGEVVGVDMTVEQLATAQAHIDWHMRRFGYARPNVRFLKGYIEKLGELRLEPASFDVIVSNCVINLSIDKPAVLRGAYDLLKPGGELYFADVYCDRRLPDSVRADPVLYGECLGGALYWNDFLAKAKRAGFLDPPRDQQAARHHERGDEAEARPGQVLLRDVSLIQARWARFGLRRLRAGRDLQGQLARPARRVRSRRPSSHREGQGLPRVRQYLAHARRHAVRAAFRFHGRFRHALRHLPRLRHVDPLRHYNVCRLELWWQLLLTRKNVPGA